MVPTTLGYASLDATDPGMLLDKRMTRFNTFLNLLLTRS